MLSGLRLRLRESSFNTRFSVCGISIGAWVLMGRSSASSLARAREVIASAHNALATTRSTDRPRWPIERPRNFIDAIRLAAADPACNRGFGKSHAGEVLTRCFVRLAGFSWA